MKFRPVMRVTTLRLFVGLLFPAPAAASNVLWMEQAQRLQEVSAALLETVPVPQPLRPGLALAIKSDLSFLPSPNPTVGAKIEKLPSAPIQSVPTVAGAAGVELSESEMAALETWVGFLPPGVEKLLGIKASLAQTHFGARIQLGSKRLGSARLILGVGIARTISSIEGQISSEAGTDTFTARSDLKFADISVQHVNSGIWAGVSSGRRRAESRLSIVEDETDLKLIDTMSSAKQPYWTQFTVGLRGQGQWSVALSELIVPDRVEMPRLSLAWTLSSQ